MKVGSRSGFLERVSRIQILATAYHELLRTVGGEGAVVAHAAQKLRQVFYTQPIWLSKICWKIITLFTIGQNSFQQPMSNSYNGYMVNNQGLHEKNRDFNS